VQASFVKPRAAGPSVRAQLFAWPALGVVAVCMAASSHAPHDACRAGCVPLEPALPAPVDAGCQAGPAWCSMYALPAADAPRRGAEVRVREGMLYAGPGGISAAEPALRVEPATLAGIVHANPMAAVALATIARHPGEIDVAGGTLAYPGQPTPATLDAILRGDTDRDTLAATMKPIFPTGRFARTSWHATGAVGRRLRVAFETELTDGSAATSQAYRGIVVELAGDAGHARIASWAVASANAPDDAVRR